jgi:transposase
MALRVRAMSPEERAEIQRLAQSRTAAARLVERAQIIWRLSRGERVPAVARGLSISEGTARTWVKRFNAGGVPALQDRPRPGRRATYPPEIVGEVLATSLADPKALGQPFASWTVRRLETYLNEVKGIPIKRSRIDELLLDEGLRWRTQESWFGERAGLDNMAASGSELPTQRLDPQFAEKRGRSSGFTPPHPPER